MKYLIALCLVLVPLSVRADTEVRCYSWDMNGCTHAEVVEIKESKSGINAQDVCPECSWNFNVIDGKCYCKESKSQEYIDKCDDLIKLMEQCIKDLSGEIMEDEC